MDRLSHVRHRVAGVPRGTTQRRRTTLGRVPRGTTSTFLPGINLADSVSLMEQSPALSLTDAAVERLASFASMVRASPHNLLSARALEEIESRHIPECLGLAAMLPANAGVLDVGTGGGFPGMVVAIARPDLRVTLLDSTSKKVGFLAAAARELGIDVATLDGRSEDLVNTRRASVDVVTARAVAPLRRLLSWTLPWLRPGGALYAVKGERWERELRDAVGVIRRTGARVVEVTEPGTPRSTGRLGPPVAVTPRVVIIRVPG